MFGGTGVINADGRQIAFPTNAPHPLANLHFTQLEAYGILDAFEPTGNRFGE